MWIPLRDPCVGQEGSDTVHTGNLAVQVEGCVAVSGRM